jgi:hypothetical protein
LPNSNTSTYACGGILRSALNILSEVGSSLVTLAEQGFNITVVGHSLGGAVATLVAYLLRSISIPARCFAYGSPCCTDALTSDLMKDYVTTVVLHDDLITRITPASIRFVFICPFLSLSPLDLSLSLSLSRLDLSLPLSLRILLKEVRTFRHHIYKHLQQDWNDVLARVVTLWSPRTRETALLESSLTNTSAAAAPIASNQTSSPPITSSGLLEEEGDGEEGGGTSEDGVLVSEEELIQLWLPGNIVHLYARRGIYRAALVPRDFSDLRRINVQGNIFKDHSSMSIFEALQEVRAAQQAKCDPPPWVPYNDSEACKCCQNNFTWHSTFRGEAQQYRER